MTPEPAGADMFTETELRAALQHSATRAHALPDIGADATTAHPLDLVAPGRLRPPRRGPARRVLPFAAAAAVVAAALIGTVVTPGDDSPDPTPAGQARADTSAVFDAVRSANPDVSFDLVPEGESRARTGGATATELVQTLKDGVSTLAYVLGASSPFDPAALDRSDPVRIAGTTGYYVSLSTYPLDGTAGVDDRPGRAIAFPRPDGTWVVVSVVRFPGTGGSLGVADADAATLVNAYDELDLSFAPDGARLPFDLGYLPSGERVLTMQLTATDDRSVHARVELIDDRGTLTIIEVAPTRPAASNGSGTVRCRPAPCGSASALGLAPDGEVTRTEHGLTATVFSETGKAVGERILDHLTIAPSATDRSGWWTVDQVFG